MKKFNLFILTACLMFVQAYSYATNWNSPDHGYFTVQSDIDHIGLGNKTMATISFNNAIYIFTYYSAAEASIINGQGQITLRKLTNTGSTSPNWSCAFTDKITSFNNLYSWSFQPAPVVFNNTLYLFAYSIDGFLCYSVYNVASDTWSSMNFIGGNTWAGTGMAAAVVGNKLCVVRKTDDDYLELVWTKDLITWNRPNLGFQNAGNYMNKKDIQYSLISAISTNYADDQGKKKSQLQFAYIDAGKHAQLATYRFDNQDNILTLPKQLISDEYTYFSVALSEGTVMGDTSTGHCIQAFLKRDTKDNGYIRYRIQRYQLKDNKWTKRENNLVKQNYEWASLDVNLTVATFAMPNGTDVKQFMCLFYRDYDDWDRHLYCAWVETDHLTYDPTHEMTQTLAGPSNTSYVGYIEGPPPFYLNDKNGSADPYLNGMEWISNLEFKNTVSTTNSTDIGYDVSGDVKFKYSGFNAGLSYSFGQSWKSDLTTTITQSLSVTPLSRGVYITFSPEITRAFYIIEDVHGTVLDSTYYFYMSAATYNLEPAVLKNGLDPENPNTYKNRESTQNVKLDSYKAPLYAYGKSDHSWINGTPSGSGIQIESSETQTTTNKATISFGIEAGEIFDIGVDGSFDYNLSMTTTTGNEFTAHTLMNYPKDKGDCTKLNYSVYWIKPDFSHQGMNNWWLHEGAKTQNTWCIAYEVTYFELKGKKAPDGSDIPVDSLNTNETNTIVQEITPVITPTTDIVAQLLPSQTSLSQNYPNPFNPSTIIKYEVGSNEALLNSSPQGIPTKLVIYDLRGTQVAMLVNEAKQPGSYQVEWNASQVTPGIYFYSLQSGSFKDVKKLVLIK